ncbi:MAG TPA: multidrug ABC transporter permease, partial [Prevotella sp.]|nr:multidrug ABC transporter permease [Prevotella sp.]
MKQFFSFIKKETKHILRDHRTMLILFGMPVVMMFLFGFAIRTDVKNVNLIVVTSEMDNQTQKILDRINSSEYFTIKYCVKTTDEAQQLMRENKANMAIIFNSKFADRLYDNSAKI